MSVENEANKPGSTPSSSSQSQSFALRWPRTQRRDGAWRGKAKSEITVREPLVFCPDSWGLGMQARAVRSQQSPVGAAVFRRARPRACHTVAVAWWRQRHWSGALAEKLWCVVWVWGQECSGVRKRPSRASHRVRVVLSPREAPPSLSPSAGGPEDGWIA